MEQSYKAVVFQSVLFEVAFDAAAPISRSRLHVFIQPRGYLPDEFQDLIVPLPRGLPKL